MVTLPAATQTAPPLVGSTSSRPAPNNREERALTFRAPLTNHHADGTDCPADHKHTSSGKPLHPDCPGRTYSQAICSCGDWQMKNPGKGYANESRKRHLASHPKPEVTGPKVLRDLLSLDAH